MIRSIPWVFVLLLAMVQPYLPGRFDGSAAALSFLVRLASYASLIVLPVALAWAINPRRWRLWTALVLMLAGVIAFGIAVAAVAIHQLSAGLVVGVGAMIVLWQAGGKLRGDMACVDGFRIRAPLQLLVVPVLLVMFQVTVLPWAADWSRDRAIRQSSALIAEIESFRERRGHYPVSLQSLNADFPTGVIGIERFQYELSGESYQVFFVRASVELDAQEVVVFNPLDEHVFASHALDILQYEGEQLDRRRGDWRRRQLPQAHWISILFD